MTGQWFRALCFILFSFESVPSLADQTLQPISFAAIAGWSEEDHVPALEAFRRSCAEILTKGSAFSRPADFGGTRQDWIPVCKKTAQITLAPRVFFEEQFLAFVVRDGEKPEGLFTGYYEPQAEGSRTRTGRFDVPVYRRPPDLVAFDEKQQAETGLAYGRLENGNPVSYLTRKQIEQGALAGQNLELVWLEDWADVFFIHIQGSGRVHLSDGSVMRLSYAAKSGLRYTGIGPLLVGRGAFTREDMSMQATRDWMRKNPRAARELMWENQSFIFFREVKLAKPELGALGAQHVQLTPQRSLAVDRSHWMFGTPVWLDTAAPAPRGARPETFRRLMIAQDTGSAIRGLARGDVYWGFGEDAAHYAGPMKSPGRMIVLLPKQVAKSLGFGQ